LTLTGANVLVLLDMLMRIDQHFPAIREPERME